MDLSARNLTSRGLLAAVEDEMSDKLGAVPGRWLMVSVDTQNVTLVESGKSTGMWPCSTALAGVDNREHSGGTPPGLHRIAQKIGDSEPVGAVFDSREPTGEVWDPGVADPDDQRDLILTRILTLEGLEDGLNRGQGVDSQERFIYLHGTNHENDLGHARSHGCIRLSNEDIIEIYERIAEGDPVVIA